MSSYYTIEKMSKIMDEMGLTELRIEQNFLFGVFRKNIHLSKQQKIAPVAPVAIKPSNSVAPVTAGESAPVNIENAVKSPMVGVAYLAPEPGAKTFVTLGGSVKAGDTLCLIEAMKTFNPVKAERGGVVKEILVTDGQVVEFDTPLMIIEG